MICQYLLEIEGLNFIYSIKLMNVTNQLTVSKHNLMSNEAWLVKKYLPRKLGGFGVIVVI